LLSRSQIPGAYDHSSNTPGLLTLIPGVHIGDEEVETDACVEVYIDVGELVGNSIETWQAV